MLIGELARRTGVSARLLRYYESQGLLAARRGPNGYRHYAEDAVVTVRQVRALLGAGLSTEVIGSVLACARGEEPVLRWCEELRDVLRGELETLDERIEGLRHQRGNLADLLAQDPA
ncbi:MerR family transcriptional regulator [Streptomyces sp. GSL17-111]|uniref:MerR family transcriptional regulator n=1 Tax=Streptomyces sp. GSL17-111 TaxID=3121596 RepID=UPI0030F3B680